VSAAISLEIAAVITSSLHAVAAHNLSQTARTRETQAYLTSFVRNAGRHRPYWSWATVWG